MNQPRKTTKLFKMLQFIGTGQVRYSEMQRFGCVLNGRDYDRLEEYQPGKHIRGAPDAEGFRRYIWVNVGNLTTRRANRGYWTVNIGHAIKMGYIEKDNFSGLYYVASGISLSN